MGPAGDDRRYRFGTFEFDANRLDLRRSRRTVRVRPQALKLLRLLLAHPGQVVSREQIHAVLWGSDTFVDFEQGVNHSIKQLRRALGDAADSPRFIETVPRRGYRFLAPVEVLEAASSAPAVAPFAANAGPALRIEDPPSLATTPASIDEGGWKRLSPWVLTPLALAILAAVVLSGVYALRGSNAASVRHVLAVAPFTTSGTDPMFGMGLADTISSRLGHQPIILVRPPTTFRGVPLNSSAVLEAGRTAGATLILSGDVRTSGDSVSVLAELVEVSTGQRTWTARYEVRNKELFSVENVLAERVADALGLELLSAVQSQLRRRYTVNAGAYEAYLRGRAALALHTPDGTRRAVTAFETALQQDASYSLARAGRAMACADMYLRFAATAELEYWGSCAESDARAALDVDGELAEAHLARAAVARKREFDWGTAIASSRRALVLNPNLDQAHFFTAAAYYHLGYMEEALIEMERGRQLRGTDVVEPLRIEALVALFSGSFAPARVHLEEVSRRSSQSIGDTYLALAYYYSGSIDRGRSMLEALASHSSASTQARSGAALAGVLAAQRDPDRARAALNRVLALDYRDHHVAYSVGAAYAQLGEPHLSLQWLGRAVDTGFPCLPWFERDPLLEPLRTHPQFPPLLDRIRTQRNVAIARAS